MARDKELEKLERAYIVTSAPGDATRYTFIVAELEPVNGERRLCFCPLDDGATVDKTHVIEETSVNNMYFSCIDSKLSPRENLRHLNDFTIRKWGVEWSSGYIRANENPYTMLEVYRIAKLFFEGRESELE